MNLDYKYFASTRDPIEIINKYRMRGFGTFLNAVEIIHLLRYSNKVSKWKELYNLNLKSKSSREHVRGNIKMGSGDDEGHMILRPRLYCAEYHTNPKIPYVDLEHQGYQNIALQKKSENGFAWCGKSRGAVA